MTRLLALLGDPVAHSLSPRLQNAALRVGGFDGVYVALRASAEDLPGLLRGIARAGGGGNVTLPHKERAARTVERRSPAAERTGAVNTYWEEGGRIHGDNTDVAGCIRALESLLPPGEVRGRRVLLLGAGGAARAVLLALEALGATNIDVWNRTSSRARAMLEAVAPVGPAVHVLGGALPGEIPAEVLQHGPGGGSTGGAFRVPVDCSLVINATPRGLRADDPFPLPLEALPQGIPLLDLVYRPEETRWIREARAAGHPAADGGVMLVEQGIAAFERWWGETAPREVFHEELARIRREAGVEAGFPREGVGGAG